MCCDRVCSRTQTAAAVTSLFLLHCFLAVHLTHSQPLTYRSAVGLSSQLGSPFYKLLTAIRNSAKVMQRPPRTAAQAHAMMTALFKDAAASTHPFIDKLYSMAPSMANLSHPVVCNPPWPQYIQIFVQEPSGLKSAGTGFLDISGP